MQKNSEYVVKFKKPVFHNINFTSVDFSKTKLKNMNLSDCIISRSKGKHIPGGRTGQVIADSDRVEIESWNYRGWEYIDVVNKRSY